jgi:hypothetical protein
VRPAEADGLDFGEGIEVHQSRASLSELTQVFLNSPIYLRDKDGVRGEWLMIGPTDGGRFLTVAVVCDEARWLLRPITALNSTPWQVARWRRQRGR